MQVAHLLKESQGGWCGLVYALPPVIRKTLLESSGRSHAGLNAILYCLGLRVYLVSEMKRKKRSIRFLLFTPKPFRESMVYSRCRRTRPKGFGALNRFDLST